MSVADYLYHNKMNVPSVLKQKEIVPQVLADELWQHEDHISIHKLQYNKAISSVDISELEKMIFTGDLGSKEDFIKAYERILWAGL